MSEAGPSERPPLTAIVRGMTNTAPEWVKGLERNAAYIGEAARAGAQILWAVGALIDGVASGLNTVADRLARPLNKDRAPRGGDDATKAAA